MAPLYIVDTDAETADGPFEDRDALVQEFQSRADDDSEDCYVLEIGEDGTALLKEVTSWLESTTVEA